MCSPKSPSRTAMSFSPHQTRTTLRFLSGRENFLLTGISRAFCPFAKFIVICSFEASINSVGGVIQNAVSSSALQLSTNINTSNSATVQSLTDQILASVSVAVFNASVDASAKAAAALSTSQSTSTWLSGATQQRVQDVNYTTSGRIDGLLRDNDDF